MNCSAPIFPGPRGQREEPEDGAPLRGMAIGFVLGLAAWGVVLALWGLL